MKTPEQEHADAVARGDIVDDDALAKAAEEAAEEEEEEDLPPEEEEEEEEEEDQPGEKVDDLTIPKARFDEARKTARAEKAALEARIAILENKGKKEVTAEDLQTEIEALEDQHENLLMEGEIEKAKVVRREMNSKRNALIDRRIMEKSNAMGQAAVEQVRYDNQLAAFEVKYPAMNPDSMEYDEAVTDEVGTLLRAFQASGMSLPASLNKAVHYVFGSPAAPTKDTDDVRQERKTLARRKTLETIKKTPANLKDIGRNSDKAGRGDDGLPDPLKMTSEQFEKLTEAQKSELRGDRLAAH